MATVVSIASIPFAIGTALVPALAHGNQVLAGSAFSSAAARPVAVTVLDELAPDPSALAAFANVPFDIYTEENNPAEADAGAVGLGAVVSEPQIQLGGLAGASPAAFFLFVYTPTVWLTSGDSPAPDETESDVTALDPTVLATAPIALEPDEAESDVTALLSTVTISDGLQPTPSVALGFMTAYGVHVGIFALTGGDGSEFECAAPAPTATTESGHAIGTGASLMTCSTGVATVSYDTDVAAPATPAADGAVESPTATVTVERVVTPGAAGAEATALTADVSILPGTVEDTIAVGSQVGAWPAFVYAEGSGGVPQFAEITEIWSPIAKGIDLVAAITQEVAITAHIAPVVTLHTTLWEGGLVAVQIKVQPKPPKPPFDPGEPDLPPPFPGG